MPKVVLSCSEEDARRFEPYVEYIGSQLRQATVVALDLKGPEEVSFVIVPFVAGDNVERFEISPIASQSTDRIMKIAEWCNLLAIAWYELSLDLRLSVIASVFREQVEVWPQMPIGKFGLYKNGKLLHD